MNKDEEYLVRKQIENIILQNTKESLDKLFIICENNFKNMIAYPITVLENQFKMMRDASVEMGFDAMELLITVNPLREAIYWFIHEMLKRQKQIQFEECQFDYDEDGFGESCCDTIQKLYQGYKNGKHIGIQRSVAKVKLHEIQKNTFEFHFPEISEEYNKELLYYYGLDDALQNEKECSKVAKVDLYLHEKFDPEKLVKYPERILEYIYRTDLMVKNIDAKLFRICKNRVSIDVNKIAEQVESSIISDKNELVRLIAFFYYISRISMLNFMLSSLVPPFIKNKNVNYCVYTKEHLIKSAAQIGINEETLSRYIDYWSMDINVEKGGFCEFPLLVFDNKVLWIPSSFMLNDFQFSIVNGHYHKNINFPKHEETIAQSIVDYIINSVDKYENIIFGNNHQYSVPNKKFMGKNLQSDIDVALYDKAHNCLLIIECKWKENVYAFTDDYVKIERAVNEVYRTQLNKHKYYLELDKINYDKIFEYRTNIAENVETLKVMYLFIDKRIQFHDTENKRHVISTFMFSYLLKEYEENNQLDLTKVIKKIQDQKTNINYKRCPLEKSVKMDGKTYI